MSTTVQNINLSTEQEPQPTLSVNPKKFILWLFIVSIIMIFASLTSAYLVRKAEGNWFEFDMPPLFSYSTVVLLVSSLTMHAAYWQAKKDNITGLRFAISITFVLGLAFLVMQFLGWGQLVERNVYLVGNPSGSFLYILSGLHGAHLISGLVVLIFALVAAFRMKIHATSLLQMQIATTYWHFLDGLWLYLFVFLLYNN